MRVLVLLGRAHHGHGAALGGRLAVHVGMVLDSFVELVHHIETNLGVGDHTTTETDGDLDLVTVGKELQAVANANLRVMLLDGGRKADLLDSDDLLVLPRFLLTLGLLETVLAVVHDLAYGRFSLRGHKNEVETSVVSCVQSRREGDYTELLAVVAYDTDVLIRCELDLLVDDMLFSVCVFDSKAPPVQ